MTTLTYKTIFELDIDKLTQIGYGVSNHIITAKITVKNANKKVQIIGEDGH